MRRPPRLPTLTITILTIGRMLGDLQLPPMRPCALTILQTRWIFAKVAHGHRGLKLWWLRGSYLTLSLPPDVNGHAAALTPKVADTDNSDSNRSPKDACQRYATPLKRIRTMICPIIQWKRFCDSILCSKRSKSHESAKRIPT